MTPIRLFALALMALLAGPATAQTDMPGMDHGAGALSVSAGDLVLSGGFARATLPGAPVAAAYVTIENTGGTDDRLVSATAGISDRVEIHEMAMDGDVMRMRGLPDGLVLPAGETVALEPGGYHLMLMAPRGPLVAGETVVVTFEFAAAGEVRMTLPIAAPGARGAAMEHDR